RVHRALGQLLAHLYVGALVHPQPRPPRDLVVHDLFAAVVRHDDDLPYPVAVLDPHAAGGPRDRRLALRPPRLDHLLDPGQTLGDVLTRDATDLEGTHGELRARLADGLGGDDAHRLAHVDQLAGGQGAAVAGRAHPQLRLAGQHAAHPDRVDARGHQLVHQDGVEVRPGGDHHVAVGVHRVLREGTPVGPGLGVLVDPQLTVDPLPDQHRDGTVGAAVVLPHDHVLGDVHQSPGEVTRVGGPQRGVRQTLTRAVAGDEVLQHGQPFPVGGLDRARDDLTLRVGDQAPDRRDLPQLQQVTAGPGVDHHPQRVVVR